MKYYVLISLLLSLSANISLAQETEADRESLARANRTMKKIDKDGNGSFEKSESKNEKVWRRFAKLDTNNDEVISMDELRRLPKEKIVYLETGGERKLDVVYKKVGKRKLKLDLYYPTNQSADSSSQYPVVVYTHGGGWAAGSKQGAAKNNFAAVFKRLLDQGFAVASVEYRLVRKGGKTQMRDCVIDSKDAVRYLAKNSKDLKLDPNRFFAMGDSAGGQIAQILLLASAESLPGDENLAAVPYKMVAGVSWYGPCDFEKMDLFNHDDRADFRDRFGARILPDEVTEDQKLELYREMSPVNYLKSESPPLLMIQGDKDTTIPVKHAYYMEEKAKAAGAPVEIMIIKNSGHNWRKVDADIAPTREEIIKRTVDFFVKHN